MTESHDHSADATAPRFVVVGHSNKGKSSIVATLAQDASVEIADGPGTTRLSARYPMEVDGRVLYVIVDTPGFQRSQAVLADLDSRASSVAERPAAVRAFLAEHADSSRFRAECELLRPIMNEDGAGAGVLYVVDGSVPYGPEYRPEMDILRWSGRPRMALINLLVDREDHVAEWRTALGQFFSVVREFNAVTAEFDKQLELLRAFGQLHDPWRVTMEEAVHCLRLRRKQQLDAAATAIARMLSDASTYVESCRIAFDDASHDAKDRLHDRYRERLRQIEQDGRDAVERIYGHPALERDESALELIESDLFSKDTQRLFGLTRPQATQISAASGVGVGLLLDVAAGGLTFGVVTSVVGTAGAVAGWFGFTRLARVEVLDRRPLGVKEVRVGPLDNVSVRHALIGRALTHHRIVAARTHAARDTLHVSHDAVDQLGAWNPLSVRDSKALDKPFKAIARAVGDERSLVDAEEGLREALGQLLRRGGAKDQQGIPAASPKR